MAEHTPGRWQAEQADPHNPEDWQVLIGGWPYGSFLPADARLIAAAPDLLEAAEGVLATWDALEQPGPERPWGFRDHDLDPELVERLVEQHEVLRAAIAKARGTP